MSLKTFPDLATARERWPEVVEAIVPETIRSQRWFKGREAGEMKIADFDHAFLPWPAHEELAALEIIEVTTEGGKEAYFLPLLLMPELPGIPVLARLEVGGREYVLAEAALSRRFNAALFTALERGETLAGRNGGCFAFHPLAHHAVRTVKILAAESTNTVLHLGRDTVCKLIRAVRPGPSRAVTLGKVLGGLPIFPALHGHLSYEREEDRFDLALWQDFLPNRGNLWDYFVKGLSSLLEAAVSPGQTVDPGELLALWLADRRSELGRLAHLTAVLHAALAGLENPAAARKVDPRPIAERTLAYLTRIAAAGFPAQPPDLWHRASELAHHLAERLAGPTATGRAIETHGDLHLGQILMTDDGYVVLDLEGEPLAEGKTEVFYTTPLRDLAGLLRSFSYAGMAALLALRTAGPLTPTADATARFLAERFATRAGEILTQKYLVEIARLAPELIPAETTVIMDLLDLCRLERAAYELLYELTHRPAWAEIPAAGIRAILAARTNAGSPI
ncbi:MAG: phosphotransferase [Firmicutes bacterium]|nr:phosphotransferase [Bacillota bacterium]